MVRYQNVEKIPHIMTNYDKIRYFSKPNQLYVLSEEEGRNMRLPKNFRIVFFNGVCNVWKLREDRQVVYARRFREGRKKKLSLHK